MKLTDEQLELIGIYHFDDLPYNFKQIDQKRFWESLPLDLQCEAIRWGVSDTVVRDSVFEHVIRTQFGCNIEQYYAFPEWSSYVETIQELDYEKLKVE